MSPTLRRGWLKRWLGSYAQPEAGQVEVYNEQGVEIGAELQALRQTAEEQAALIKQLQHQLHLSTSQQSSMAKRIQRVQDEWPTFHARYFTVIGDTERADKRKTRTSRKAKRRDA